MPTCPNCRAYVPLGASEGEAVVGISFSFNTVHFETPGGLWLTVSATGTAVKLVPECINTGPNR